MKKKAAKRLLGSYGGEAQSDLTLAPRPHAPPPLALTSAHWMTAEACLQSLQSSAETGLSQAEAERRLL
ncbi:hypothetical protein EON64_21330, partial [archaeon]